MKQRRKRGRPRGRSLAGALVATGGMQNALGDAAREMLLEIAQRNGFDLFGIAEELKVTDRTVRRIFASHALHLGDITPRPAPAEDAPKPEKPRGIASHPAYAWCFCEHCEWGRAITS